MSAQLGAVKRIILLISPKMIDSRRQRVVTRLKEPSEVAAAAFLLLNPNLL